MKILYVFILGGLLLSCSSDSEKTSGREDDGTGELPDTGGDTGKEEEATFYYGADLSYVNEMEDCGGIYRNADSEPEDPFRIFSNAGANLVRVRLWHNPQWTEYSDYDDVKKTITRAKAEGMKVLLDFHYSDNWTDPEKQMIPAAWEEQINNTEVLGDSLYQYTYKVLNNLYEAGLLPEMVQVGNEINAMILQGNELQWPIDWERNTYLINRGIKAVRDLAEEKKATVEVMLHIAQPENALWWFKEAVQNGVDDFDWIGLSYYPIWSEYDLEHVAPVFESLISTYRKRLMVVETAYPFTLEDSDAAGNILDESALVPGFAATPEGQLGYLNRLQELVEGAGGEGVVYWEPAWISTGCHTQWGQGSHWDNATLFDSAGIPTRGMEFYNGALH